MSSRAKTKRAKKPEVTTQTVISSQPEACFPEKYLGLLRAAKIGVQKCREGLRAAQAELRAAEMAQRVIELEGRMLGGLSISDGFDDETGNRL